MNPQPFTAAEFRARIAAIVTGKAYDPDAYPPLKRRPQWEYDIEEKLKQEKRSNRKTKNL